MIINSLGARRWIAACLVSLALVAAACTSDGGAAADGVATTSTTTDPSTTTSTSTTAPVDERAWPVPDWTTVDPAAAGVDPAVLDGIAAEAEAGGSDCLVVTRDGELVGEWYWNDTDETSEREAFSVTKSITATLVGIAQEQGHLDIDQPASDFIDEWVGTPSEAVTIRNLLSNDSGRFQTAESDYVQMATRELDKTAFSIGLEQEHEIGTVWVYNNAAIQTLEAVLERATGMAVDEFARVNLFEPLGMTSHINTDPAGNTLVFMGAQMSCRDMARFGLMHLRDGEWNGEQIVSAEWVAEATAPSTELNGGYGYLWWLLGGNFDEAVETAPGQGAVPSGSGTSYAALGLGGQFIGIVPQHDLVVTRLGAPGGSFSLLAILETLQTELVIE